MRGDPKWPLYSRVGNTAIFSAAAEVRTKQGILEVNFVETQRIPKGSLNGVLQISLNGKPLIITSSSGKPKSCNCKDCNCKTRRVRQQIQVYNRNKIKELSSATPSIIIAKAIADWHEEDRRKPPRSRQLRLCQILNPLNSNIFITVAGPRNYD
jgi:hypothetical protein